MNDPQQVRRAIGEIRRALDSYPREGLAEILALVFKEYVVEGHQPLASGGHVLDARSDLEGLSFPELIVWLQTHLDLPGLALFDVVGADVSVRAEGRVARLVAPRAAPVAPPLAAPAPAPVPVAAPIAARAPASTSVPVQPSAPVAPAAAPAGPVTPAKEESTAETGTRFSLLEVD